MEAGEVDAELVVAGGRRVDLQGQRAAPQAEGHEAGGVQADGELDALNVEEAAQGGEGDLAAAGDGCDVGDSLEGGRAGEVAQGVLDVGVEFVVGPTRVSGVVVAQVSADEGAHIGDVHGALLSGAKASARSP